MSARDDYVGLACMDYGEIKAALDEIDQLRGDDHLSVPMSVLRTAWVALVPSMDHPFKACNGGPDGGGPWCFTCDAMEALQPYQQMWLDA